MLVSCTLTCSLSRPFYSIVTSWIESRSVQSEKAHLTILFDKYLPVCLEKLKFGFKKITPVPEVTVIQTVLYLLECLLTPQTVPTDSPRELYELYFVFACAWAFGGAMFQDQVWLWEQPVLLHPLAASLWKMLQQWYWPVPEFFCLALPSSRIIAWSSASGGWKSSKPSSFLLRGQFLTITLIQKQRNSCPGLKKCQNSSSILKSLYRYFCFHLVFGHCSMVFPLATLSKIPHLQLCRDLS